MQARRSARRPHLIVVTGVMVVAAALVGSCSSPPSATSSTSSAPGLDTASPQSATSSSADTVTPDPDQLLVLAKRAVKVARSVHISGAVQDSGTTIAVDVAGKTDGSASTGVIKVDGATIEFLVVSGETFVRGDEKFWSLTGAPAGRVSQLAASRKWVKASEAKAQTFPKVSDPSALLDDVLSTVTPDARSQEVVEATVSGGLCWRLKNRVPGNAAEFVVLQGSYLPLRITDAQGVSLAFSEWNAVKTPTAPAASEVITG